jgi:RNA polymerase sigma-70 factor, ECF subfamily
MDPKEEILWRNIQQKDVGTFELYYKENYRRFLLLACKYLKDSAQAAEIINDVFLKIWEDGPHIRIESSLKSYIYKAIINRCLNALKKNKREFSHQTDLDTIQDEGYELRQIEENELRIRLYAAIDQLPEKCRQVFEMSRFEELKQQEIADKLGISVKTVKNHITIALKQLSTSVINYMVLQILIIKYLFHF